MKEFLKCSVLQIGSVGVTCPSLRVAGLILEGIGTKDDIPTHLIS